MKKEQIIIELEDEFTVDFVKNERGFGKAICRIEGIVGFLEDPCPVFVAPGSTWIVKVIEIKPKTLIVSPIIKLRSPKENYEIISKKLEGLKAPKIKKEKEKKRYRFLTKQELNQLKTQN